MNQKELEARLAPLGKRSQYELIRALYIWVSYGVQVQFSGTFSKMGMRIFAGLCNEFPPMFKEEDEQRVKRLTKSANISFTIEALCRILQNIAENCKTLQNSAKSAPSSDKESEEASEESSPLNPHKEDKEEDKKKKGELLCTTTCAQGEQDGAEQSSITIYPSLHEEITDFLNYWNAQDQRLFVPCQFLNEIQSTLLHRIITMKGMPFIKSAIDICANAEYLRNNAFRGYKIDTVFFLNDENFSKIINHRYDHCIKKLDKYQQAVEDNRRNALNDLQRATREALESDEGLLGKL